MRAAMETMLSHLIVRCARINCGPSNRDGTVNERPLPTRRAIVLEEILDLLRDRVRARDRLLIG